MEKRYQVFVSSTYTDLKEERQKVIQTIMEADCIPSGMELFPAADEEQFNFIKKIIDDCDYYLLIIGGRYGSTTPEGVSYTEKEYDYAIEKGLKVIAFLHSNPEYSVMVGRKRILKCACSDASLPDVHFHDLGHTAITRMLEKGISPPLVMKISGHSQMKTFLRYVNQTEASILDIAQKLDRAA